MLICCTDQVTFTEEILNEKLHFLCSEPCKGDRCVFRTLSSSIIDVRQGSKYASGATPQKACNFSYYLLS